MSLDTLAEKQVVMDGKELRGGSPESPASQGDCLPGAWVGENHIMVGQLPLNGKENEIAAIPRLLDKRAHYILSVKDNQEALHEVVTDATRFGKPFDTSSEMEDKAIPHRWLGMETLVEIEPEVIMGEKKITTIRHHISDEDFPKAAYYAMLARGHRGIENQLRWHLDVTFKEDAIR